MRNGTDVSTSAWLHEFEPSFHPTVMLVAYVNSYFIIIRQNFFPVSFSSKISVNYHTTACRFSIGRQGRLNSNIGPPGKTVHCGPYLYNHWLALQKYSSIWALRQNLAGGHIEDALHLTLLNQHRHVQLGHSIRTSSTSELSRAVLTALYVQNSAPGLLPTQPLIGIKM